MIRRVPFNKYKVPEPLDHDYLADIEEFDDQSSNDEGFGSAIDSSGGFTNISDNFLLSSKLPTMFEDDEENMKINTNKDNTFKIWDYQEDFMKFEVSF